jgi:hypothetical protein
MLHGNFLPIGNSRSISYDFFLPAGNSAKNCLDKVSGLADSGQEAGGRRRREGDRMQETEDRRQRAEDRKQKVLDARGNSKRWIPHSPLSTVHGGLPTALGAAHHHFRLRNRALSLEMLKMKIDPAMCMKTKAGRQNVHLFWSAFHTKMHQLSGNRRKSVGLRGRIVQILQKLER